MVESPALRALSLAAIRVMHRLEVEHMHHGGAENGRLQVTYDQFVEFGLHRNSVGPAIRELEALGFVEITEKGVAGNENQRRANRFRLTYVNTKNREQPSDDWRQIATVEEAERRAEKARRVKDRRASALGRRGSQARLKNKSQSQQPILGPLTTTDTERQISQSQKPILLGPVTKTDTTIYISGGSERDGAPEARLEPGWLANLSMLPWSPPRRVAPKIEIVIRTAYRPAPIDALAELEGLILSNAHLAPPPPRTAGAKSTRELSCGQPR